MLIITPIIQYRQNSIEAPSWKLNMAKINTGEGNGTPLQHSCLDNPMDGGAWWAAVHGVTSSRTWLSDFTFTFHVHALEEEMATHSSVLAWRIPGTGEPGGLPSMGLHRVGHDWNDLAAAARSVHKSDMRGIMSVFSSAAQSCLTLCDPTSILSPQNSCVEVPVPTVTTFGGQTFK